MKLIYSVLAIATAAALTGCDQNRNSSDMPATNNIPSTNKISDAMHSAKDSMVETKDQFVAAVDQKMKDLDAKIDELRAKSANYKDDAKVQADKALDDLHEKRSALGTKYDELKQSTKDGWDKTKEAFDNAWDKVQNAYDIAKAKFTS